MSQIIYKKGDLFTAAKPGNVLAHACNCQGVWGSGIAKQFKERFPKAFLDYKQECSYFKSQGKLNQLLGSGFWLGFQEGQPIIAALFTSMDYGKRVDKPSLILKNTKSAFCMLLEITPPAHEIHIPKINSGLFKVPWEQTEKVLLEVLKEYPKHKVFVWEKE